MSSLSSLFSPPIIPPYYPWGLEQTTSTWTKHLKRIFYGLWTILDINWRRRQFCGPQKSCSKARDKHKKTALYFRLVLPRGEKKRKIWFFGKIFHFGRNTKVVFDIIFAPVFEKMSCSGFWKERDLLDEREWSGFYRTFVVRLSYFCRTFYVLQICKLFYQTEFHRSPALSSTEPDMRSDRETDDFMALD